MRVTFRGPFGVARNLLVTLLLGRLEVRAFMAAQNMTMADTGAAVLRGFLRRADADSGGTKNKIIISFNKIMVRRQERLAAKLQPLFASSPM